MAFNIQAAQREHQVPAGFANLHHSIIVKDYIFRATFPPPQVGRLYTGLGSILTKITLASNALPFLLSSALFPQHQFYLSAWLL